MFFFFESPELVFEGLGRNILRPGKPCMQANFC